MFMLGYNSALGYTNSGDITPTSIENITYVSVSNQICDSIGITKDTSNFSSPFSHDWDINTILIAEFENCLIAGNVNLLLSQVDNVRIKYRKLNTYKWTIFADIPIEKASDLIFERYHRFCNANTTYEFSISTMLNGVESETITNTIESKFNGFYIMEKDTGFGTDFDVVITPTRQNFTNILNTLDGKYPVTVINSENNYETFSVQGLFIPKDTNGDYLKEDAWQYRRQLKDFLFDGNPKYVKDSIGRSWLVMCYDNITSDESKITSEGYVIMTFNCVECGDPEDTQDLYDANLIDINTDYYY